MSDEQGVWDALKALLGATNIEANVYDYGQVPGADGNPGNLPAAFVLLSVERRYVEPRQSGGTSVTGWRASVRYVGLNTPSARAIGGWVRQAFEVTPGRGKRVTVDGIESTPITHETTSAVAKDDDGRYSGLSQWTVAL